jgi:hypothetical protein
LRFAWSIALDGLWIMYTNKSRKEEDEQEKEFLGKLHVEF